MLEATKLTEAMLIAMDLRGAIRSEKQCCQHLIWCYDRAMRVFNEEAGQADPKTIHLGLSGAALGLQMLIKWAREVPDSVGMDLRGTCDEAEQWLRLALDRRGLTILGPDDV